jgi:hypothetical protein
MMHDPRSTFGNHRCATGRTAAPFSGEGLTALFVNYGVLHTDLPEVVGLILTVRGYQRDKRRIDQPRDLPETPRRPT